MCKHLVSNVSGQRNDYCHLRGWGVLGGKVVKKRERQEILPRGVEEIVSKEGGHRFSTKVTKEKAIRLAGLNCFTGKEDGVRVKGKT